MENESFWNSVYRQFIFELIVIFIWFLIIFDNKILVIISYYSLGILVAIFLSLIKQFKQSVYILIIIIFSFFATFTYLSDELIIHNLIYPYIEDFILFNNLNDFGLVLGSTYTNLIVSSLIISLVFALSIYYNKIKLDSNKDIGIFGKMLTDLKPLRILFIMCFLIVASFYEELIFRYILINVGLQFNLSLIWSIIISSILFGRAHNNSGGFIMVINSASAGIAFANIFINFGIFGSWILHLCWNAIIFIEIIIFKLMNKK